MIVTNCKFIVAFHFKTRVEINKYVTSREFFMKILIYVYTLVQRLKKLHTRTHTLHVFHKDFLSNLEGLLRRVPLNKVFNRHSFDFHRDGCAMWDATQA